MASGVIFIWIVRGFFFTLRLLYNAGKTRAREVMRKIDQYPLQTGSHPDTTMLRNILAHQGLKAPHTGLPLSEALLLGVGGVLGMGYILWEFKEDGSRVLVLSFRNNWQYPQTFVENLCERLNIAVYIEETGSRQQAGNRLTEVLRQGQPAMVWLDLQGLPYLVLPESLSGQIRHVVGVFGMEGEGECYWLDDRAPVGLPALEEVAEQYRQLEGQWQALGGRALPDELPAFARIKALEKQKLSALVEKGAHGLAEYRELKAQISALQQGYNPQFPLGVRAVDNLLAELRDRLMAIYLAELSAGQDLRRAVGR